MVVLLVVVGIRHALTTNPDLESMVWVCLLHRAQQFLRENDAHLAGSCFNV